MANNKQVLTLDDFKHLRRVYREGKGMSFAKKDVFDAFQRDIRANDAKIKVWNTKSANDTRALLVKLSKMKWSSHDEALQEMFATVEMVLHILKGHVDEATQAMFDSLMSGKIILILKS